MESENLNFSNFIDISTEEQASLAVKQYDTLIESVSKINDVRESSNTFWITANTLIASAISYLISTKHFMEQHKPIVVWTLLGVGFLISVLWLRALVFIKKTVNFTNKALIEFEKFLPAKIFTLKIQNSGELKAKDSLTVNEALVPGLFILGYIFFSFLLFKFKSEIINCSY